MPLPDDGAEAGVVQVLLPVELLAAVVERVGALLGAGVALLVPVEGVLLLGVLPEPPPVRATGLAAAVPAEFPLDDGVPEEPPDVEIDPVTGPVADRAAAPAAKALFAASLGTGRVASSTSRELVGRRPGPLGTLRPPDDEGGPLLATGALPFDDSLVPSASGSSAEREGGPDTLGTDSAVI